MKYVGFLIPPHDFISQFETIADNPASAGKQRTYQSAGKPWQLRRIISGSRHLDCEESFGRQFDTQGIRSVLDGTKGTAIYESYTKREVLGSYVWLPRYQWGILAEMEAEEILWPLEWIRAIGVLTTLIVSLICLSCQFCFPKVSREPVDDPCSPAFSILSLENRPPYIPLKEPMAELAAMTALKRSL